MPVQRKSRAAVAVAAATLMLVGGLLVPTAASAAGPYTIQAGKLTITLDDTGLVTKLVDSTTAVDYASTSHQRSLIQLKANGAQANPTGLSYDQATSTYDFNFGTISTHVFVKVATKAKYSTFEVTSITPGANVDVSTLFWGPITTNISKTVGETVGIVSNSAFAIGIHGLNNKSLGGWVEEDKALSYYDSSFQYKMPFDWNAAYQTSWGSILQAYTMDYSVPRTRGAGETGGGLWMPNQPVPVLSGSDGKIVGSKIALFGNAPSASIGTLSDIETAEGLPHPTIDGQWQKTAQATSQVFLVLSDLNTGNVAQASQYANAAGINYLYSLPSANGPWASQGHFNFNSSFGSSDAGAKGLVDTAATYGVKVGVHTLSNFIDGGDAYTHPIPDAGLVKGGQSTLTRALAATGTDIYVSTDAPFRNSLDKYVQIGNELANFTTITQISSTEWKLSGGARAMWGTTAAAASVGATVYRLIGNEYNGAVGGLPIIDEIATRFATIANTTGVKAMSYDGLEANTQVGYGTYAAARLLNGQYAQQTSHDGYITEASNLYPSTWDAQSRISWGEGGLDPSDRLNTLLYLQRNLMPAMIGWLPVYSDPITMEAQLAKMAGFNSGAGFRTSMGQIGGMTAAQRTTLLSEIKEWEAARNSGAFTPNQRAQLRTVNAYWHLNTVTSGSEWTLQQITSAGDPIGAAENVKVGNTDPATAGPVNLALTAQASASSTFSSVYVPGKVNDGIVGQPAFGEWASKGESNPWVQLDWTNSQTFNTITFNARSSAVDVAPGGTLTFSDGTSVPVSGIPNDGSAYSVTFPAKTATWVKFQVAGGTGPNVGLSEMAVTLAGTNLAQTSTATASSSYDNRYLPSKAIDGIVGQTGTGEWASLGAVDPWLKLTWTGAQTINRITLNDRANNVDWAPGGTLTFSDGSSVSVSGIANNGTTKTVTFPDKTVTWVKFEVAGGSGSNVGLSEVGAYRDPNLATGATATASSSYDSRYLPAKAIDGIVGQTGTGEWASLGALNPNLTLTWPTAQTVNTVTLFDRANTTDWAPGGTLTFSDNSSVAVSGIPNDGTPINVTFSDRSVTWVKFQVVDGSGRNVGLSEMKVLHQ